MKSSGIRMWHGDVYAGALMIGIGTMMMAQAFGFPAISRRFPLMGTGLFVLLGVAILAGGLKKSGQDGGRVPRTWESAKYPLATFLIIAGYVALIPRLGFLAATGVAVPVLMLFFGVRSWKSILFMTLGLDLFVWLLFVKQLKMVLP